MVNKEKGKSPNQKLFTTLVSNKNFNINKEVKVKLKSYPPLLKASLLEIALQTL